MTAQLAPTPIQKFFDNNGNPLFNGKLYSYVAGTSTPQATYTDSTMGTQNTNPVILNARGEANVWLDTTLSYKLVLQEANGTQIWAVDNIPGNGVFGTVQNIAALRNVTGVGVSNYQAIIVDGYTTAGDGGGGTFWWNSTSTVADNGGTIIAPTGVSTGRWYRNINGDWFINWFGADSTGSNDSTTAINNAISTLSTAGGGNLWALLGNYKHTGIVLKQSVILRGLPTFGDGNSPSTSGVRFTLTSGTKAVDATGIFNAGIIGASIIGIGVSNASLGINVGAGSKRCIFQHLFIDNFGNQAILDASLGVHLYDHIFAENCVGGITQSSNIGVMQIGSVDNYISHCEIGASQTSLQSTSLYTAALYVTGSNNFISDSVFEFADVGVRTDTGSYNRFNSVRSDYAWGKGWDIAGSSNSFVGCWTVNCSQTSNGGYDAFYLGSGAVNNTLSACVSETTATNNPNYGFNDQNTSLSTQANNFSNCRCLNYVTAEFNNVTWGSTPIFNRAPLLFGSASWTPGTIGAGAHARVAITVTGLASTDFLIPAYSSGTGGCDLTAYYGSANQAYVQLSNVSAAGITPSAGTAYVIVIKGVQS